MTVESEGVWQSRIVGFDPAVDPETMLAFPGNPRIHPRKQSETLRAVLSEVGWVDAVIVNQDTGHVVDGHLRVADAITAGCPVPVLYVSLTETEEAKVVATFDAIGDMAVLDQSAFAVLLHDVTFEHEELTALAADLLPKTPNLDPEPDVPENPVVWGYVAWGKNRNIDSSETEVTALDAAYETFVERNDGDDTGFIATLLKGELADGQTPQTPPGIGTPDPTHPV